MTGTALLLLDYQVALAQEGDSCLAPPLAAQVRERGVLATAKRVLGAAREAGVTVIHVRLAFDPTYGLRTNRLARFDAYGTNQKMRAGSPEAEFVPDVAPIDGEPVVDKGCVNAFIGTPLRDVLAAEGIQHVVLGGVATHLVVESTARHASDSGLQVSIVEDMCAAPNPDVHDFAFAHTLPLFGTVTTADDVVGELVMSHAAYDVVVVGGGIAGLSAALSAVENGARVALLDRATATETGGNTRYTEAYLRMKTLDEAADGLAEALVDDFMGHPDPGITSDSGQDWERRNPLLRSHQVVDLDYVAAFEDGAGPTLRWLQGHGISFGQLPTLFLTVSTSRMAPVGGGLALVETLGAKARSLGVDFHFETTARSLVMDDDGTVTGLLATGADGARHAFTGTVVLASGGYQGNSELMARYHGRLGMLCRPVARGGNYNKGEGLEMALAVGAATAGNFSLFHAEPVDPRSGEPEAAIMAFTYGVLVNTDGERFVDEARGPIDAWYERTTRDIQAQPKGMAWMILDARGQAIPNLKTAIRTEVGPVRGATLVELATKMDVDVDALVVTVSAYNEACPEGEWDPTRPDGLATSGVTPPKSNWAKPVAEGPFVAYPIMCANVFTFGGLKVDATSRVVDRDGRVIRGLYAAGEMTGLYYSNYTGSTSVLRGATFGRIAGKDAAMLKAQVTA